VRQFAIHLSEASAADVIDQSDWYASQSDTVLVQRWELAVSTTLLRITEFPTAGARCHFKAADLRGVRRIAVDGFPRLLVFYRVDKTSVLILRVLHGARDLESLF